MGKLAPTSIKYVIKASIKAKGIVEKPDVIGAVFGQTEGLLGSELDLRELQKTGRIGRIDVKLKKKSGNSEGEITIPSSLGSAETALIAAAVETIERVGPCEAEISIEEVEDTRKEKRGYVMDRAKSILKNMAETSEAGDVSEKIKESVKVSEITSYKGNAAGPDLLKSEDMMIVEGRADVINLLKHGITNTVAMGGTSLPKTIAKLTKKKNVTIFTDGDRGGDLIIQECLEKADIDYVIKAPDGKEVEELTKKEIYKALRKKMTVQEYLSAKGKKSNRKRSHKKRKSRSRSKSKGRKGNSRKKRHSRAPKIKTDEKKLFKKTLDDLIGTRAACIFGDKGELLGKVPVSELPNTLKMLEKPKAVVFDGKVDRDLERVAKRSGLKFLVGMKKNDIRSSVGILEKKDL